MNKNRHCMYMATYRYVLSQNKLECILLHAVWKYIPIDQWSKMIWRELELSDAFSDSSYHFKYMQVAWMDQNEKHLSSETEVLYLRSMCSVNVVVSIFLLYL